MQSFTESIRRRLTKYNKNFIGICVGPTGSGKSWAMLRLAQLLDPSFDVSRVVFSITEFKELLNSKTLKPGNIIVWEEAGVSINSRRSLSKDNVMTSSIAQTFRHLNYGLLFTVPDMHFVDVNIRKLAHMIFKPVCIDRVHRKCLLDLKKLQNNEILNRVYAKSFYYHNQGRRTKIDSLWVGRPTSKLLKDYEARKTLFTDELNRSGLETEEDKKTQTLSREEIMKLVNKDIKNYTKTWGDRIRVNHRFIKANFKTTVEESKLIKQLLEGELNGA